MNFLVIDLTFHQNFAITIEPLSLVFVIGFEDMKAQVLQEIKCLKLPSSISNKVHIIIIENFCSQALKCLTHPCYSNHWSVKGRSFKHQIDAIEQLLSNEILSGFKFMEDAVTTAKWKVYNDCTV